MEAKIKSVTITHKFEPDYDYDFFWMNECKLSDAKDPDWVCFNRFRGVEGRSRNEYRYFCAQSKARFQEGRKTYSELGCSRAEAYDRTMAECRQDWKRFEELELGWWNYEILTVQAVITIEFNGRAVIDTLQGSLSGIESDSSYKAEYVKELTAELMYQLKNYAGQDITGLVKEGD